MIYCVKVQNWFSESVLMFYFYLSWFLCVETTAIGVFYEFPASTVTAVSGHCQTCVVTIRETYKTCDYDHESSLSIVGFCKGWGAALPCGLCCPHLKVTRDGSRIYAPYNEVKAPALPILLGFPYLHCKFTSSWPSYSVHDRVTSLHR